MHIWSSIFTKNVQFPVNWGAGNDLILTKALGNPMLLFPTIVVAWPRQATGEPCGDRWRPDWWINGRILWIQCNGKDHYHVHQLFNVVSECPISKSLAGKRPKLAGASLRIREPNLDRCEWPTVLLSQAKPGLLKFAGPHGCVRDVSGILEQSTGHRKRCTECVCVCVGIPRPGTNGS